MSEQPHQPRRPLLLRLVGLADWISIASGAIAIVIAIVIGVSDLFLFQVPSFIKDSQSLVVLLLGLLALGIGLERRIILEEARKNMERIQLEALARMMGLHNDIQGLERKLDRAVTLRRLMNEDEVFEEVKRLLANVDNNHHIRATSTISGDFASVATNRYVNAYAQRVQTAQAAQGMMYYYVVFGYVDGTHDNPPAFTKQRIETRRAAFKAAEIDDERLQLRRITANWPMDLLLIDDSLIIGFATRTGRTNISLGLSVTDSSFVRLVTDWYDHILWADAEKITWAGDQAQDAEPSILAEGSKVEPHNPRSNIRRHKNGA
jgi:hypothetical protein